MALPRRHQSHFFKAWDNASSPASLLSLEDMLSYELCTQALKWRDLEKSEKYPSSQRCMAKSCIVNCISSFPTPAQNKHSTSISGAA